MSQVQSAAARRARDARVRHPRCPVCKAADVTGAHVDQCEELDRYRQRALAAGRAAGIPEVTTLDLWAHAHSRCYNPLIAALLVEVAIDLGWRPVVGNDRARLWPMTSAASWPGGQS